MLVAKSVGAGFTVCGCSGTAALLDRPSTGPPKKSLFVFPRPPHISFLLPSLGSSRGIVATVQRLPHPKCVCGQDFIHMDHFSRPAELAQNDTREAQAPSLTGPRPWTAATIPREHPRERSGGRRKKTKFWASHPRPPMPPFGLPSSSPLFRRLHSSCRACAFAYGRRQANMYILRPEHDVKRLPNDGGLQEVAGRMEWSMRLIPRTRCRQTMLRQFSYGESSPLRLTSRPQMSSFTAWSDEVFFRQGVESSALLSLSASPMVTDVSREKAGYMERSMHLSPTRCRQPTLRRFSGGKLAGEIDESTLDVVVYGLVRWRPLGRVSRRRLSPWNGRCA